MSISEVDSQFFRVQAEKSEPYGRDLGTAGEQAFWAPSRRSLIIHRRHLSPKSRRPIILNLLAIFPPDKHPAQTPPLLDRRIGAVTEANADFGVWAPLRGAWGRLFPPIQAGRLQGGSAPMEGGDSTPPHSNPRAETDSRESSAGSTRGSSCPAVASEGCIHRESESSRRLP